jgi:hypothetical protein
MLRFNFAEIEESKYKQYIRVDLGFSLIVFLLVIFLVHYQTQSIKREIGITDSRISQLNSEIKRLRKLKIFEGKLLSLKTNLQNKLSIVSNLEKSRHVPNFLYFFEKRQNVSGVWLDRLKYNKNTLSIEANALDLKLIPQFLKRVDSELGTVKLRDIERKKYENRDLNFKIDYYKFKFSVRLRNGPNN